MSEADETPKAAETAGRLDGLVGRTAWDGCEHEWEAKVDSQFSNELHEDVECVKCGCPGERTTKTGEVFWPAT